jgi:hypothetical protein
VRRLRPEFMRTRIQGNPGPVKILLRGFAVLCFVLGVASRVNAANTSRQQPQQGHSVGLTASFAIADFDGDRKPDFATVEAQKGSSSNTTRYSIRLQLTAGATQVFGVIAPAGGLQIVARDVNGDNALDVLVSTAWLNKQVAVLLNDGHGNFTLADPAVFPSARREGEGGWNSGVVPLADSSVLVRIEYSASARTLGSKFHSPSGEFGKAHTFVSAAPKRLLLSSLLGRAPPTFVLPS